MNILDFFWTFFFILICTRAETHLRAFSDKPDFLNQKNFDFPGINHFDLRIGRKRVLLNQL
jgi:hypothetical protein